MSFPYPPQSRLAFMRPAFGACVGIFLTGSIGALWLGGAPGLPALIAPMGASAVLLFALPASPLAQPWSILGGNFVSALIGIACGLTLGHGVGAAALAAGLAIAAMIACRCLHPPGGAVALTAVIGGPAIAHAGLWFAVVPVAVNSSALLCVALLFNNLTRHRYPHRAPPVPANQHGTGDAPPQERVGATAADIDAALARYDELLDVDRDDLLALFRQVEAFAHGRLHGRIRCDQIMSRDLIVAHPEDGVGEARDRLLASRLGALPVVDASGRAVGIVGHAELLAGAGRHVRDVMNAAPCRVRPHAAIDELLPALSGGTAFEALVTDPDGTLCGVITQTDLIAALWRSHVAEQVARTGR